MITAKVRFLENSLVAELVRMQQGCLRDFPK